MWLKNLFLLCSIVLAAVADDDIVTEPRVGQEYVQFESSLGDAAPQGRAIPVEDFVTSHKIPDGVPQPSEEDEEEAEIAMEVELAKEVLQRAVESLDKRAEKKKTGNVKIVDQVEAESKKIGSKRQARVELENFSDSGVLSKDGIRKLELARAKFDDQTDAIIPGVQVSAESPTTNMPVLTTPREVRAFDFVPVNIIREDSKDAYTPYADRHFGDLSDVSLVPAGSNSRVQVKKGPNGKDYEYEYVYYYYDEEDEGKGGSDAPVKSTPAPTSRRGSQTGRNKYSSIERSTTAEPATNEVIPSRATARNRQVAEADEVAEERLPANTRFPPRSRSNHNTGTTEASRARGNRPRPSLDLVDSSSFRTHQEGPEFPQNLPKGPVRFLGVTPNEEAEEKPTVRGRSRTSKPVESTPVEETPEEVVVPHHRRRPTTAQPEVEVELTRGQPSRPSADDAEEEEDEEPEAKPEADSAKEEPTEEASSSVESVSNDQDNLLETSTTEIPTTENPAAMDKVALDLYAFLLQGQSNVIDSSTPDSDDESTTIIEDADTTEVPTTTEIPTTTTEPTTTTTTTEPTTTTTTTTEPPTTTTQLPVGNKRFRRPGTLGGAGSRSRFNQRTTAAASATSTTTEASAPAERTQRPRGRFGAATGGFKRPRPGQRQEQPAVEEEAQKETSSSVNAERPTLPRGRFRGSGSRTPAATTSAPASTSAEESSSKETSTTVARPAFNRVNLNRRRGRPTTPAAPTSEEAQDSEETAQTSQETVSTTAKPAVNRPRLPGTGLRTLRPGPRLNPRLRPGLATSTTAAPETPEPSAEEPTGAGTEEASHEAPAETSPPAPTTPETPLTRLRNRNRLQVHPKAPRVATPPAPRRSPLLPRRKTTEAPVEVSSEPAEVEEDEENSGEVTEAALPETSTAASQKQEEVRGLSSLLAPRRRIAPRRPGQLVARE